MPRLTPVFHNSWFRTTTMCSVIIAVMTLCSLSPLHTQQAQADPYYRVINGRYYYGGEVPPGYGYNAYSYNPYVYYSGGASYASPGYTPPSYQANGFDGGVGNGVSYNGLFGHSNSRFYGQPYRPAYTPYGFSGYGPYRN